MDTSGAQLRNINDSDSKIPRLRSEWQGFYHSIVSDPFGRENDWYVDNVVPDTLSNVLSLGQVVPGYKIGVVWFSVRYKF